MSYIPTVPFDNPNALLKALRGLIGLYKSRYVLKSIASYRSTIRANVRALWTGEWNLFQFVDAMVSTIEREFPLAWRDGAKECGVSMSELTDVERAKLASEIQNDLGFIIGFGQHIEANRRGIGLLRGLKTRTEYWVQGYTRVMNVAKTMACGDKKLQWTLNPAEHCSSCLKLDGKVKRASFWNARGVHPKSHNHLKCRQKCRCELKETDLPLSPGPLPSLP